MDRTPIKAEEADLSGAMGLLKTFAHMAQNIQLEFEELADDCDNANGHGDCLINTADGCLLLGCPLAKED